MMRLALLLLACLFISSACVEAAKVKRPPPKKKPPPPKKKPPPPKAKRPPPNPKGDGCDQHAAFDALLKGEIGAHNEVIAIMRHTGTTSIIREAARNAAVLAPHNKAAIEMVVKLGLPSKYKGLDSKEWKLSASDKTKLVNELKKMIVTRTSFRNNIKLDHPCKLVATTHDHSKGFDGVMHKGAPLPSVERSFDGIATAPSGRRKLAVYPPPPAVGQTGVLGTGLGAGYDAVLGMPISAVSGGVDPGLYQANIFDMSQPLLATISAAAPSCSATLAQSSFASSSAIQSTLAASLSVSGKYLDNSFSASGSFKDLTDTKSEYRSSTTISGSQITFDTYTLNITNATTLSSGFLSAMESIRNHTLNNETDLQQAALTYLYNTYGTHYLTSVTVGAQFNMIVQMSSASSAMLKQQGIDVSEKANACYGLLSGAEKGSYDSSSASQIQSASKDGRFTSQEAPSTVSVPFTSGGIVNCTAWTLALKAKNAYVPVSFQVAPIADLLGIEQFWPEAWKDSLPALFQITEDFLSSCVTSNCTSVSTLCNSGFYGSGGEDCTSCYASEECIPAAGCESDGTCIGRPGLLMKTYSSYTATDDGFDFTGLTPTSTVQVTRWNTFGCSGTSCPVFSREFTGYFVPALSGTYRFTLATDDRSFLWMDTAYTSGALTGTPSLYNSLDSTSCCTSTAPSSQPLNLTAGYPYPIRIQWGNYYGNTYYWLYYQLDNGPAAMFLNPPQGGYFFYIDAQAGY